VVVHNKKGTPYDVVVRNKKGTPYDVVVHNKKGTPYDDKPNKLPFFALIRSVVDRILVIYA
jgi:hypothetical protein